MGIYYLIYCEEDKEYIEPTNIKYPHGDEEFCMAVLYAMKTRWFAQNISMVADTSCEIYYEILKTYKDLSKEVLESYRLQK